MRLTNEEIYDWPLPGKEGNNWRVKAFYLKAKARIWLSLSYMAPPTDPVGDCSLRSAAHTFLSRVHLLALSIPLALTLPPPLCLVLSLPGPPCFCHRKPCARGLGCRR